MSRVLIFLFLYLSIILLCQIILLKYEYDTERFIVRDKTVIIEGQFTFL